VAGLSDQTVWVWDAKTGKVVAGPFEGHTGPISSVAFSPDCQKIVSGSSDLTVRVWDAKTSKVVAEPNEGHTGSVSSFTLFPDGQKIVLGLEDQTVQVQDVPTVFLLDTALSAGLFTHANHEADFVNIYNDSQLVNGWMQSKNSELLFWLPPYYRRGLWGPNTITVMARHTTKLDFSQFVHGTSWTQCFSNLT
jgi:WD40 repeat protein